MSGRRAGGADDGPVGAEALLGYFENVNRAYPDPHWRDGARMCRRWLALADDPGVCQADIDGFVARLEAETEHGSGWDELGMRFRHWARSRGFQAWEHTGYNRDARAPKRARPEAGRRAADRGGGRKSGEE